MYDCYFTNVLTQHSCFEVLLTAGSLCFTRHDARTFIPTIPRRRRAFTVSWNIEVFVHSNSASGVVIFFSPGSPVSSFLSQPTSPSFPSHSLSTRRNQLSPDRRRHESHQTYRSYQLVLHLGTSTTLFPAIWTRTARSIEELFSQWTRPKRASSDQRTDEEDTSETCNNNHAGGRTMTKAKKRNWGRTYIYVLGHRDGRFGDVYIRPVAVNGLNCFTFLSDPAVSSHLLGRKKGIWLDEMVPTGTDFRFASLFVLSRQQWSAPGDVELFYAMVLPKRSFDKLSLISTF